MDTDPSTPKLGRDGGQTGSRVRSLFARVLTLVAGAAVLAGAIAVSIVVFAIVFTGLAVVGIWFWWRMRRLRKQMQTLQPGPGPGPGPGLGPMRTPVDDNVIEGEVIRRPRKDDRPGGGNPHQV